MNLYSIDSELLKKVLPIQKSRSKKDSKKIENNLATINEDEESNTSGETLVGKETKPPKKRSRTKSVTVSEPLLETNKESITEIVQEPVKSEITGCDEKDKKPLSEKQMAAIEKRKILNAEKKSLKEKEVIAEQVSQNIMEKPKKLRRLLPRPPRIEIDSNADLISGIKELISTLKNDSSVKGDKKEIAHEARQASKNPETLGKIKNEISSHRKNMISMIFPNRMV